VLGIFEYDHIGGSSGSDRDIGGKTTTKKKMIRIRIRGQSFLLHQIRLMIGAAVLIARGTLPEISQKVALVSPYFIQFPMAPAEGLILLDAGFGLNTNGKVFKSVDIRKS
jgi:tRNA U38,U39,U40 pseudouridine synthase TruA